MRKILLLATIVASAFYISCEENDPPPQNFERGAYDGAVFISNEGNFGEADGSLSAYFPGTGEVVNNLYTAANERALGDVVQSLHLTDEHLFIAVNNSNIIEVLSLSDSLKSDFRLPTVSLPRYMTSFNGKLFLTEWVSFSEKGRVSIYDIETRSLDARITTDFGAEGVLVSGNQLYVSNSFTNTVTVIDLTNFEVIANLEVGNGPAQMKVDVRGNIWVVCTGGYDENFMPLNDGRLAQINPASGEVNSIIELEANVSGKIALNAEGNGVYYLEGASVKFCDLVTGNKRTFVTPDGAVGLYGIAIPRSGQIYVADAKGFAENGTVHIYDREGVFETSFTVGRGPNWFEFN